MSDPVQSFYDRDVWKRLRYAVLKKYGFRCMACGGSQEDGTVIQVDHILPISIYPELALDEKNLQVLCKECNSGKRNLFFDDHRPILRDSEDEWADHLLQEEKVKKKTVSQLSLERIQILKEKIRQAEELGEYERQTELLKLYQEIQKMKSRGVLEDPDFQEYLERQLR